MACWADYLEPLFTLDHASRHLRTAVLEMLDADPPNDETASFIDDVKGAVAWLSGGKAAGDCNISAEVLNAGVKP